MKEAAPRENVSVESLLSQMADEFMQRLEHGNISQG
jgi:hypothetical protein